MSDAIIKNKAFLDLLCKTKSEEQRQALLDTATPGQIRALSEVALNLYCKRTKQPVLKHSKLLLEENLPLINKLIKSPIRFKEENSTPNSRNTRR